MQSNVVKSRSLTTITTGLIMDESTTSPLWRCRQLARGCHKDTNDTIQYGCGAHFNECHHTHEWKYVGRPAVLASYTSRAIEYTGGSYYTHARPEFRILDSRLEYQRPIGTTSIVVPWDDIERARTDAYTRLLHLSPPQHMNVLRSAMELKDTKQTIDGLVDFTRWCYNLCKAGYVVLNGKVKRAVSLATSVATFAKYYLTYKFGIEPTIADTKQFLRELSEGKLSVKGSQAAAGYRKGQTVVVRYVTGPSNSDLSAAMFPTTGRGSATVPEQPYRLLPGTSYITVPFDYSEGFSRGREVVVQREVGCYFAELTQDLDFSDLESLRRRWAWNCPSFRTLWDLCPFSFLIDWFVDVGASIERIEKRYVMRNYSQYLGPIWWARKVQTKVYHPALRRFDVSASTPQPPDAPGYGGTLNVGWTWEAAPHLVSASEVFDRRPVTRVPTALWPVLGQRLSAYQISTGMALLLSLAGKFRR